MAMPPHALLHGLGSYNSALTSMAVATFFAPRRVTVRKEEPTLALPMIALSVGGAALTAVVALGVGRLLAAHAAPALTLPFCITASLAFWLVDEGSAVPSLALASAS